MIRALEVIGSVSSFYAGNDARQDRINARIIDLKKGMREDSLPNGWEAPNMGVVIYPTDRTKVKKGKGYEAVFGRVFVIGNPIEGELERYVAEMVLDKSIHEIPQFAGGGYNFGLGVPDIEAFSGHHSFYAVCNNKENLKLSIGGVRGMQDGYKKVLDLTRKPFTCRETTPDINTLRYIANTEVNSIQFKPMFSPIELNG